MDRFMNAFGIILFGFIVSGCASDGMMESSGSGASTSSGGGTAVSSSANASSPTKNIDRVASGSVEDTLNACLARIPKDASAGQKMLAEESCRRDQAARR